MNQLRRVTVLRATVAGSAAVMLLLGPASAAGAVPAATANPGSRPVRGLDISAYQHRGKPINWRRLKGDGIKFAAVKLTESNYYSNPYYAADVRAANAAGMAVLSYVFANPADAFGKVTARFAFTRVRAAAVPVRLPLVVDLENDPYKKKHNCYGKNVPTIISWISGFLSEARDLTGKWPIIYTTAEWWRQCTRSTSAFHHDPLWLADYDSGAAPTVPSPWRQWTFWQYKNDGRLPGIGLVDEDYYKPSNGLPDLKPKKHKKHKKHKKAKPKAKPKKHKSKKHKSKKPKKHPKPKKHLKPKKKTHKKPKRKPKK
jgi:GH25 family lysozyme M1 (1,4-beta-N-acetylmuramidase)